MTCALPIEAHCAPFADRNVCLKASDILLLIACTALAICTVVRVGKTLSKDKVFDDASVYVRVILTLVVVVDILFHRPR